MIIYISADLSGGTPEKKGAPSGPGVALPCQKLRPDLSFSGAAGRHLVLTPA